MAILKASLVPCTQSVDLSMDCQGESGEMSTSKGIVQLETQLGSLVTAIIEVIYNNLCIDLLLKLEKH